MRRGTRARLARTPAAAASVVLAGLVLVVSNSSPAAAAGTLTNPTWAASPTTTGTTGATYTYGFTLASTSSLNSVTMTLPAGTGGTPTVGTVTPSSVAAGATVSRAGTTLTYSFTATTLPAGLRVSIQINALTNTSTAGSNTATLTTLNAGTTVDTGTTPPVTFTSHGLTSPTWSPSSSAAGATAVSYQCTFTTVTNTTLNSVAMGVPAGTAGAPAVGTVSGAPSGGTVTLAGTSLTYTFTPTLVHSSTAVSIQITGLTNTTVPGSYAEEIVTNVSGVAVDSGTTAVSTIAGSLALTSPASLTWADTLNGTNQSVVDTNASDQQLTVADTTATGAGWHVTASATTPKSGSHTLPTAGTLVYTGSITSVSAATAPTPTCSGTCTLPANLTTYPVAITTAATAPPTFTIYDASVNGGLGTVIIGAHTSANPGGWWVNVPANSFAGTYTSTITLAVVSGP